MKNNANENPHLQWHPAFYAGIQIEFEEERTNSFLRMNIIDDFYLVYAYACLYKSDTLSIDEISAEEITITFVCSSVISIIAAANKETFLEVTTMSEVLEQIFLEVHGERLEGEKQKAIDEAVAEKDAYIKELEAKLAQQNNL